MSFLKHCFATLRKHCLIFSLAVLPIILNPFGVEPYSTIKNAWFIVIVSGILLYLALKILKHEMIIIRTQKFITLAISFSLISLLISTIYSKAPIQSFFGDFELMHGSLLLTLLTVYFIFCLYFFRKDNQKSFFDMTILVGVILSLYACLQFMGIDPIPHANDEGFVHRAYAMMGNPNFLGQFLIFPFSAAFFYLIQYARKHQVRNTVLLGVALAMITVAILLTHNRATMLGITGAGVLLMIFFARFAWRYKIIVLIATILIGIGLGMDIDLRSLNSRLLLWQAAWPSILLHPWIGTGIGTTYQAMQQFISPEIFQFETMSTMPDRVHNWIIEALLEQGILGLLPYFIIAGYWIKMLWGKASQTISFQITSFGVMAYAISGLLSFSTVTHAVFLLTFLAILINEFGEFHKYVLAYQSWVANVLASILILSTGFLLWLAFGLLTADILLPKAISALATSSHHSLLIFEKSSDAAKYFTYPRKAEIFFLANEIHKNSKIEPFIEKRMAEYSSITNNDFAADILHLKILDAQNDLTETNAVFQAAKSKAPVWPELYLVGGEIAARHKDYTAATDRLETLRRLTPPYFYWKPNLNKLSWADREKYRIFRKTNMLLYRGMNTLQSVYYQTDQLEKAEELGNYL